MVVVAKVSGWISDKAFFHKHHASVMQDFEWYWTNPARLSPIPVIVLMEKCIGLGHVLYDLAKSYMPRFGLSCIRLTQVVLVKTVLTRTAFIVRTWTFI